MNRFVFHGTVNIALNISKKTDFVIVHHQELSVDFAGFKPLHSNQEIPLSHQEYVPQYQYAIYHFNSILDEGEYQISLKFNGKLANNNAGYYLATYKLGSETKYIATTQFAPISARFAFPCLDEPEMKAKFQLSMTTEKSYHALNNMPLITTADNGVTHTFHFEQSVKMSTYLVAYVVSEYERINSSFESVSTESSNGVKLSVYTAKGSSKLAEYALSVTVPILEYYQNAFDIDFPLPKLDLIAIPDMKFGAMENWGLITYRDTAILYDPQNSTPGNKQRVATVIAHEFAHQWFGNLVTMEWWTDIWLNEGFAEFMQYKAAAAAEPSWNLSNQFIVNDLVRALQADESLFTHQIAQPVSNPEEISTIFDAISYAKGSSVLRMVEAWMDEKYYKNAFIDKISTYLKKHAYGNAKTSQLWDALSIDQDISKFMDSWTDNIGFPFLEFKDLGKSRAIVKQNRFIFANLINPDFNDHQIWSVPVSFTLYSNETGTLTRLYKGFAEIASLEDIQIEFDKEYPNYVLFANYGQTGVYRSLYEEKTYQYAIEWLNADLDFFPPVERAGLIGDAFAMTFSGRLKNPTISMELLKLLKKDTNILVWDNVLKDMETLKDIFALYPTYGPMIAFQTRLIENVIESIGWIETSKDKDSHHLRGLLRARLFGEAVRNNHRLTVAKALEYFNLIKQGKKESVPVTADVFGAIFDAGVIYGGLEDYEYVQRLYLESTFAPDQQLYLHALASTKTAFLQTRTLNFAIGGQVRKQDLELLINQVAGLSPVGHLTVWYFLLDNWDYTVDIFEEVGFDKLNSILKTVVSSFTNPYLIKEADRLFVSDEYSDFYVPPGSKTAVSKGLETSRQLLAWRGLYGGQVADWLTKEGF
ncbi:hypothetical protein HDV01_007899 [Terramyces sp. JEL0728]|nr:hypothetical protein HDV01_007899 [Terramyces sp. JEL0728]